MGNLLKLTLFLLCFSNLSKADIYFFEFSESTPKGQIYQFTNQAKSKNQKVVLINAPRKFSASLKIHDPKKYITIDGKYKSPKILVPRKIYLLERLGHKDYNIPESKTPFFPNLLEIAYNSQGFLSFVPPFEYLSENDYLDDYNLDFANLCQSYYHCLFDGTLYDSFDYGNLVWGATVRWLGVTYHLAKMGSELNELLGSHRGITEWTFDSMADQEAIRNGYFIFYHYLYGDLDKDKSLKENFEAITNRN